MLDVRRVCLIDGKIQTENRKIHYYLAWGVRGGSCLSWILDKLKDFLFSLFLVFGS